MIKKLMPLLLIGILLIGIGCIGPFADEEPDENDINGNDVANETEVTLYYFWGDGCPVCPEQEPAIDQIEQEYDEEVEVRRFEIYNNPENAQIFQQVTEFYGVRGAVPATFIGEEPFVGLTQKSEFENKIDQCLETGECEDPVKEILD